VGTCLSPSTGRASGSIAEPGWQDRVLLRCRTMVTNWTVATSRLAGARLNPDES
jgi:hypothetical protein